MGRVREFGAHRTPADREYGFHGLPTLAANGYLIAGPPFVAHRARRAYLVRAAAPPAGAAVESRLADVRARPA